MSFSFVFLTYTVMLIDSLPHRLSLPDEPGSIRMPLFMTLLRPSPDFATWCRLVASELLSRAAPSTSTCPSGPWPVQASQWWQDPDNFLLSHLFAPMLPERALDDADLDQAATIKSTDGRPKTPSLVQRVGDAPGSLLACVRLEELPSQKEASFEAFMVSRGWIAVVANGEWIAGSGEWIHALTSDQAGGGLPSNLFVISTFFASLSLVPLMRVADCGTSGDARGLAAQGAFQHESNPLSFLPQERQKRQKGDKRVLRNAWYRIKKPWNDMFSGRHRLARSDRSPVPRPLVQR